MRRIPFILLAMLLLARPHAAHARTPALGVPVTAIAGEQLVVRWADLPAGVGEVELELSLDGGRWVRISPELESAEGRFVWRVPALASGHAVVRLLGGGEGFERELMASREFRIDARVALSSARPTTLDWWTVGEHTCASGWRPGGAAASPSHGLAGCQAVIPSQSQVAVVGPGRLPDRFDEPVMQSTRGVSAACRSRPRMGRRNLRGAAVSGGSLA